MNPKESVAFMKIATWNIERLKHQKSIMNIKVACDCTEADILVLTETVRSFDSHNYLNSFHTPELNTAPADYPLPAVYKEEENRVSIYTNYPLVKQHKTYDKYTSLCVELETDKGNLIVYGTIIGTAGNRSATFKDELDNTITDIERLSKLGSICICGDFNCSFSDNYYYTKNARMALDECFLHNEIHLLTYGQPECIDHIAVSKSYIKDCKYKVNEWNIEKSLSDHKGVLVDIYKQEQIMKYHFQIVAGWVNTYSGWSFEVYENGKVILKKYKRGRKENTVFGYDAIEIPKTAANELHDYLISKQEIIKDIPCTLWNMSYEDIRDTFYFLGDRKQCCKLFRHTKKEVNEVENTKVYKRYNMMLKMNEPAHYALKNYKEVMIAENAILDVVIGAFKILEPYGLMIIGDRPFQCQWGTFGDTEYV